MSSSALAAGLRQLRRQLAVPECRDDSDEQLLSAFIRRRDDSAFAVLVHRHGPMVLQVCRRLLSHEQDAEDAFQAVFLVLARQAASLRNKGSLAGFLHGTSYRIARDAKRSAARRRKHEGSLGALAQPRSQVDPADELSWREIRTLLDEEIARLPETYRSAFVLCYLEDLSRAEAAQRLGLKECTLLSRLAKARKRLAQRLSRRGVELTAVLAASTLATQPASALPAGLLASTVKAALTTAAGEGLASVASASVAELVKGATAAMIAGKAKMVTVVLLTATLLAGAGTCWILALPQSAEEPVVKSPPAAQAEVKPAPAKNNQSPPKDKDKDVKISGTVFGPDGKPVKGARLYWPRVPKVEPESDDDIEILQRAASDAEGGFRFELPCSDINPDWNLALIAAADGYGVAWANWSAIESGGELTLRLVKDQPIEGRILNTEGRPQAGVRVSIGTLGVNPDGKLDLFLGAWKRNYQWAPHWMLERMFVPLGTILGPVTTAKDGSFRITGAGVERLVALHLSGSGIGLQELFVINRAGFDAAAVNKAVLERIPAEFRSPDHPPLLYGPKFTYVRPASRHIEGTVREVGSGKPVAGYRVGGTASEGVSDKQGRYKLGGVPKEKEYLLTAEPPANTSWLRAGARIADTEGVQPLTVDLTVARGILVSGRAIDKTTGKGAKGYIRFVPLAGNKFADKPGYDSFKYERNSSSIDAEGRFQLAVIPGPGVLMVNVDGPYKPAELNAKERKQLKITAKEDGLSFTDAVNGFQSLSHSHAVKYVDFAPDAGTAQCAILLQRGRTMRVKIEDADGKPVTGTTVAGAAALAGPISVKDAVCTVVAVDPKRPRRLIFYHAGRNLAVSLTVSGTEKEPPIARLLPMGSVTGRLLDRDGQPIAGADIDLSSPDRTAGDLYRRLHQLQRLIRTDKDGRFRIEGIVPDVEFALDIYRGRTFFVGEPRIGARQVKAGETLDLGAIRVKPAR